MRKFCDCVFSLWTLRYVFEWEQLDCYLLHESPNSISIWTFTRPWLDLRLEREKSESVAILIILPAGYCNIKLVIISLEGYNNIKMFSVFSGGILQYFWNIELNWSFCLFCWQDIATLNWSSCCLGLGDYNICAILNW